MLFDKERNKIAYTGKYSSKFYKFYNILKFSCNEIKHYNLKVNGHDVQWKEQCYYTLE